MSNSTFQRMLMQHRIDNVDLSVYRRNHSCNDAQPVCGQTIESMCI